MDSQMKALSASMPIAVLDDMLDGSSFETLSPTTIERTEGKFVDFLELTVGQFVEVDEFACHDKSCAPPPVGTGGSSKKRDTPIERYGIHRVPGDNARSIVRKAKRWTGWDQVPITTVPLKGLRATESHLQSKAINKVLSGEPLREGYDPTILIDRSGNRFIIDGHHRVAMHQALGNKTMKAHVLDLRTNPKALTASIEWPVERFEIACDLHGEFACHSAACAPPPAGTGGSVSNVRVGVKGSTAKGFDMHEGKNQKAMERAAVPDKFWDGTMVEHAKESGLAPSEVQTGDQVQAHFASNIRNMYAAIDQFGNETTNPVVHDLISRSGDWYPAANKLAARRAEEFGVSPTTSVAVLAALSPGHDWDSNIQEHEIVLNVTQANKVVQASVIEPLLKSIFAGQMESAKTAEQEQNVKDKLNGLSDLLERVDGKNFNNISSEDRARILKAHAIATGQDMNKKLWEVDESGDAVANGLRYTMDGTPQGISFQSERTWKNIFDLIDADKQGAVGTPAYERQVSVTLGQQAKVRSFFNNIANPNGGNDVTIDTHATSVVAGRRVAQKSPEYKGMAEGRSAGGDGFHGAYVAATEAYRQVAAERGIAPRAAQSQTWVAQKGINDAVAGNPLTESIRNLLKSAKKRSKLSAEAIKYFENELRIREAFLQLAESSGYK